MIILVFALTAFTPIAFGQSGDKPATALTFLSHRSGYNQLLKSKPDGSEPQPVFGGPITGVPSLHDSCRMYREPHWTRQSPNGKYFASWVYENGLPQSEYKGAYRAKLVVGDLNRTWTRIVNPDCQEEFAWSPDSRQLAFSVFSNANYQGRLQQRGESSQIFVSNFDGSSDECVFEQNGIWIVLDWSPDGKRLLVEDRKFGDDKSEHYEFRLADALRAKREQRKYNPDWNNKEAPRFLQKVDFDFGQLQPNGARYSPTRNELVVAVTDPQNMYAPNLVAEDELGRMRMMRLLAKIYVFDMNTKKSRLIADFQDGIRGPICWSPSGNDIYFSRYLPKGDDREKMAASKEHGLSIWAVKRDGENPRFITTGWSPDFPRAPKNDGK